MPARNAHNGLRAQPRKETRELSQIFSKLTAGGGEASLFFPPLPLICALSDVADELAENVSA